MKNKLFVIGAIVVAVVAFAVLKFVAKPEAAPEAGPQFSQEDFVKPHSPVFGNTLSPVTVVEWFDPECESCRAIHPIFKKIMAEYSDRVRFVYRYMPYHAGSMFAATALEEARELGKLEQALDLLYEKQPEWGDHHQPRSDLIPSYLVTLGIPKEKLERDYLLKKHGDKVLIDETDGKKVGVQGTPTFFVNGRAVIELGDQPLRAAIDAALASPK